MSLDWEEGTHQVQVFVVKIAYLKKKWHCLLHNKHLGYAADRKAGLVGVAALR